MYVLVFWYITFMSIIFGDDAFCLPFAPSYLHALTQNVFGSPPQEPACAKEFATGFSHFLSALVGINMPQIFRAFHLDIKYCDLTTQLQTLLHVNPCTAIEGAPGDKYSHCLPADTPSQQSSRKHSIIIGRGWPSTRDRFSYGRVHVAQTT